MQTTLLKEGDNALTLEKTNGQYWLELRNLPTGNTRIIYFNRADKAKAMFKNMAMPDIIRIYDKLNVPVLKMYKEQEESKPCKSVI